MAAPDPRQTAEKKYYKSKDQSVISGHSAEGIRNKQAAPRSRRSSNNPQQSAESKYYAAAPVGTTKEQAHANLLARQRATEPRNQQGRRVAAPATARPAAVPQIAGKTITLTTVEEVRPAIDAALSFAESGRAEVICLGEKKYTLAQRVRAQLDMMVCREEIAPELRKAVSVLAPRDEKEWQLQAAKQAPQRGVRATAPSRPLHSEPEIAPKFGFPSAMEAANMETGPGGDHIPLSAEDSDFLKREGAEDPVDMSPLPVMVDTKDDIGHKELAATPAELAAEDAYERALNPQDHQPPATDEDNEFLQRLGEEETNG